MPGRGCGQAGANANGSVGNSGDRIAGDAAVYIAGRDLSCQVSQGDLGCGVFIDGFDGATSNGINHWLVIHRSDAD